MTGDPASAVPEVSIVIANHNGADALAVTIPSLLVQRGIRCREIILADNASTDRSVAFVREEFPSVRIIETGSNRGPNVARQKGLDAAGAPLVLIMDNDLVLSPDYISQLAGVLRDHPDAGAASGRIRYYHQPDQVQYNGVDIHYVGEIRLHDPDAEGIRRCTSVSAGAMLVRREVVEKIGGFDLDYFFGWEDGDLTFRMSLSGYSCWICSDANAFHQSKKRGLKWVQMQIRNRWWFLRKNYDRRTFLLALPAILAFQSMVGVYLLLKGHGRDFLAGTIEGLGNTDVIRRKHAEVQRYRTVSDRDLLNGDRLELAGGLQHSVIGWLVKPVVSAFFWLYWILIRPFLRGSLRPA